MTKLEKNMIKEFFGVEPKTGIEYSSSDNCFDYWEGKDENGEDIIVSLSTCEWALKEDGIFRPII